LDLTGIYCPTSTVFNGNSTKVVLSRACGYILEGGVLLREIPVSLRSRFLASSNIEDKRPDNSGKYYRDRNHEYDSDNGRYCIIIRE